MTVEFLIYAVGGGKGHFVRGRTLQRLISESGRSSMLLVIPGSDADFPPDGTTENTARIYSNGSSEALRSCAATTIIVDTFPFGWRNELSIDLVNAFPQKIFLGRFHRNLQWEAVTAVYDHILLPYPLAESEWEYTPRESKCLGFLVRSDAPHWDFLEKRLVVVDIERRLSEKLFRIFEKIALRAGFSLQIEQNLTQQFCGEKFIVIGAGYNTFYETLRAGADALFMPIKKRFDDQFMRANRFQRTAESLRSVEQWLTKPRQAYCEQQSRLVREMQCTIGTSAFL